jgi:octaprenyl-diphosphate synthase
LNRPLRADADEMLSPADALSMLLSKDLGLVEAEIARRMESSVGMIPDLAGYLVEAGGKRLRPLITLAAAQACGGGGDAAVKLATAVEFIHSATLLHDDVVDRSGLRRGKRAANLVWGDKASVLVGDFLFARAFNLMVETGDIRTLDVLARASSVIAEGEVMQLVAANEGDASRSRYYAVIDAKTAALFAAAARVGAMAAGADERLAAAFETYGREIGLAFQLADDALDYGGYSASLGKNVGDDFREGKATLPLIVARERGDAVVERAFWDRVLAKHHSEDELETALSYVKAHGAVEETLKEARQHAQAAKAALAAAPSGPITRTLNELADYCVDRVA